MFLQQLAKKINDELKDLNKIKSQMVWLLKQVSLSLMWQDSGYEDIISLSFVAASI
jgi:hypothetical protein